MIQSMTGFARSEIETPAGQLTLELRSVNHRYLDTTVRLPEQLRTFEMLLRESIQGKLIRGKVECNVHFFPSSQAATFSLDEQKLESLLETTYLVEVKMKALAPVSPLQILEWPGVLQEEKPDENTIKIMIAQAIDQALQIMTEMRQQEGTRLKEIIETRLTKIAEIVAKVQKRMPEVLAGVRTKLLARLESLNIEADEGRLEQELAFIAQKLDIDEELDRLESHITAAHQALKQKGGIGRRLDFIMQEFNREANTMSSKSADSETTAAAVELKVLIEQMREQIQNIE